MTKKQETARVKNCILELLSSQKTAALSTYGEMGPYINIVAFAGDGKTLDHLLFATPRSTRKYGNISREKRVALLIENSRNREDDFHRAMAVTVTGAVRELTGRERERAAQIYLSRHPYLEEFIHSLTCAMMEVAVQTYFLVEHFQKVSEFRIRP